MLTKKLLQCYNLNLPTVCGILDQERLTGKKYESNSVNDNQLIKIRVEGLITTIAFHKAKIYAQKLAQHLSHKYAIPQIREMLQVDWYEYLQKMKVHVGGRMWILKRQVAVFINDEFIGSDVEFLNYINDLYVFHMLENSEYYDRLVKECYKEYIRKTKRIFVYFTFTYNGSTLGSFLFMLYSDLLPNTCKHFLNLCTGKYGNGKDFSTSHYSNSTIHRIVKNGWIQFGDIKTNKAAIPTIPDESYCIPHNRRGVLSMANNGKHSNMSQVIVCLKPNPWMDYHYVAFGQLVDGIHTLKEIENMPVYYESPIKEIIISYCGEYIIEEEPKLEGETDIFLERQPWIDVDGEHVDRIYQYPFNTYSDISMWLDNIIDEIDIRDTASFIIAERYLSRFYCLSTDYLAEKSLHSIEKDEDLDEKQDVAYELSLRQLLINFEPEKMTKDERSIFVRKLWKVILSYALSTTYNEDDSPQIISKDSPETIHKILEYAYDIARAVIAKSLKDDANNPDTRAEVDKYMHELNEKLLLIEKADDKTYADTFLSLIEEILNKSIRYSLLFTNTSRRDSKQ